MRARREQPAHPPPPTCRSLPPETSCWQSGAMATQHTGGRTASPADSSSKHTAAASSTTGAACSPSPPPPLLPACIHTAWQAIHRACTASTWLYLGQTWATAQLGNQALMPDQPPCLSNQPRQTPPPDHHHAPALAVPATTSRCHQRRLWPAGRPALPLTRRPRHAPSAPSRFAACSRLQGAAAGRPSCCI